MPLLIILFFLAIAAVPYIGINSIILTAAEVQREAQQQECVESK